MHAPIGTLIGTHAGIEYCAIRARNCVTTVPQVWTIDATVAGLLRTVTEAGEVLPVAGWRMEYKQWVEGSTFGSQCHPMALLEAILPHLPAHVKHPLAGSTATVGTYI